MLFWKKAKLQGHGDAPFEREENMFAAKPEQVLGKDRVRLEFLEGAEHGDRQFETPENIKKALGFLDKTMGQVDLSDM